MQRDLRIFSSPYELAEAFASDLVCRIVESAKKNKRFSVALSGGSTPELLFKILADNYSGSVPWEFVHFFWGDERCVPPDDPRSNYGMTMKLLFDKIIIPASNIHRIIGENDSQNEAARYSLEISDIVEIKHGLPGFDMIILGMGEDGHTASLFPGSEELLKSQNICEAVIHPVSHESRITLTGRVLNNAVSVTFLVTGRKKADIVEKIIRKSSKEVNFPAGLIVPVYGELRWFIDKEAGSLL